MSKKYSTDIATFINLGANVKVDAASYYAVDLKKFATLAKSKNTSLIIYNAEKLYDIDIKGILMCGGSNITFEF